MRKLIKIFYTSRKAKLTSLGLLKYKIRKKSRVRLAF